MKIFVLHYTKLVDRKKHILSQFEKHNIIDYEFIEKFDKDEITEEDSCIFVKDYSNYKSTMSLHLKHNFVYKEIANKYDCALILEDDVILSDNFKDILDKYITQLPEDYDMLFIGDGNHFHIEPNKINPDKNIYEKSLYPTQYSCEGYGASRCADSYLINKKCAIKLCEYINNLNSKIQLTLDCWLDIAARDNNFNVYWAEPTIVTQGTQTGLFKTSLDFH